MSVNLSAVSSRTARSLHQQIKFLNIIKLHYTVQKQGKMSLIEKVLYNLSKVICVANFIM